MEPYLADLINNKKVPKIIRYIIVTISCLFITYIGITTGIYSELLIGNIFGFILAITFIIIGIILIKRIYKS